MYHTMSDMMSKLGEVNPEWYGMVIILILVLAFAKWIIGILCKERARHDELSKEMLNVIRENTAAQVSLKDTLLNYVQREREE